MAGINPLNFRYWKNDGHRAAVFPISATLPAKILEIWRKGHNSEKIMEKHLSMSDIFFECCDFENTYCLNLRKSPFQVFSDVTISINNHYF